MYNNKYTCKYIALKKKETKKKNETIEKNVNEDDNLTFKKFNNINIFEVFFINILVYFHIMYFFILIIYQLFKSIFL